MNANGVALAAILAVAFLVVVFLAVLSRRRGRR